MYVQVCPLEVNISLQKQSRAPPPLTENPGYTLARHGLVPPHPLQY